MLKKNEQIYNTVGRPLLEKYITLSVSQREVLEQIFAKTAYPTNSTLKKLAEKLGLTQVKVYNWFRCERMRVRYGKCQETDDFGEFVGVHSVQVESQDSGRLFHYVVLSCTPNTLDASISQ